MSFRDTANADIGKVFFNASEFSTDGFFFYDGRKYECKYMLDTSLDKELSDELKKQSPGLFTCDARLYVPTDVFSDENGMPRRGAEIEAGDEREPYIIREITREDGILILSLLRYDE